MGFASFFAIDTLLNMEMEVFKDSATLRMFTSRANNRQQHKIYFRAIF
jgi:hypothetical protein